LIAAAALAAGIISSSAQGVYSLNVVGYVNLTLQPGFNMIANPLDFDGTGTNNTIAGVFGTNLPSGSTVYLWVPASGTYVASSYAPAGKGGSPVWDSVSTNSLNPGQGCFVNLASSVTSPITVTVVGNVLQGSLANPNIPATGGFGLLGSQVPLAGGLQTVLNYTPTSGDVIEPWDPTNQVFGTPYSYAPAGKGGSPVWSPSEPVINVGQGFFLDAAGSGEIWTNSFSIQ